jgi:aminobenzoyl-glutamate utilization protein B
MSASLALDKTASVADEWIDSNAAAIVNLSDRIWDFAEPGLCETQSAAALCDLLSANGFSVERGAAKLPTAFVARYGSGRPRIGLVCEYDAIPGEAQRPSPFPDPDPERHAGFTDLHNGIGVASAAAAVATAKAMAVRNLPGTLVVFGTPAEKLCIGKPFMARAGLFDDLDAVVAWHPRIYSTVEWDTGPGCYQAEIFDFHGRSTYGGAPWNGVSALDALTLMNVIVQFMREHFPRDGKVSINEMVSRGGDHPTAIPNHAQAWYVHRGLTRAVIDSTSDALDRAAHAAASALSARYDRRIVAATRPWLPNHTIAEVAYRNLQRAGAPRFPKEAHDFARKVLAELKRKAKGPLLDEELTDPRAGATADFAGGADDVTEFCWHAPTARIYIAHGLASPGLPNWARSAFTRTSAAHATIMTAARAVAFTALDLMQDSAALKAAAEEHGKRLDECGRLGPLLPRDVDPPTRLDSAPPYVREHLLHTMQGG